MEVSIRVDPDVASGPDAQFGDRVVGESGRKVAASRTVASGEDGRSRGVEIISVERRRGARLAVQGVAGVISQRVGCDQGEAVVGKRFADVVSAVEHAVGADLMDDQFQAEDRGASGQTIGNRQSVTTGRRHDVDRQDRNHAVGVANQAEVAFFDRSRQEQSCLLVGRGSSRAVAKVNHDAAH